MLARDMLGADSLRESGMVHIRGLLHDQIRVVGATLPVSVRNDVETNSFYVQAPEPGKVGLVAVHVTSSRYSKKEDTTGGFLLTISWKDDQPFVDLTKPWMPLQGRAGQMVKGHLEIRINGRLFTTSQYMRLISETYHVIRDGDLICRYMNLEVDADVVIHAATQVKVEENAIRRLSKLQAQLDAAMQQLSVEQAAHAATLARALSAEGCLKSLRTWAAGIMTNGFTTNVFPSDEALDERIIADIDAHGNLRRRLHETRTRFFSGRALKRLVDTLPAR